MRFWRRIGGATGPFHQFPPPAARIKNAISAATQSVVMATSRQLMIS